MKTEEIVVLFGSQLQFVLVSLQIEANDGVYGLRRGWNDADFVAHVSTIGCSHMNVCH